MKTAFPLHRQPFQIYDIPKIDNNIPPHTPKPPAIIGDYCFKAQSKFLDESGQHPDITFVGYDNNMSITDKVYEVCKIHEKREKGKCTPVKLSFIGNYPKCDGRINIVIDEP